MSVRIDLTYEGDLRCSATHQPSGTRLVTDAPVDNHGRGESFSPTDLVATGLGSCLLTIMGIAAARIGVDMKGARAQVTKEMVSDPRRRIARLDCLIEIPGDHGPRERKVLEQAARNCPVRRSLGVEVEIVLEFVWVDQPASR